MPVSSSRLLLTSALCLMALPHFASARELSGSLGYLARIALAPETEWMVELTDATGARVTAQGPMQAVPQTISFEAPDQALVLTAALRNQGQITWVSAPQQIAAGESALNFGDIRLSQYQPVAFQSLWRCGENLAQVGFSGEDLILNFRDERRQLPLQPSASGARFADSDGRNQFWNKGSLSSLTWDGEELGQCSLLSQPPQSDLIARGTEPGWVARLSEGGLVLSSQEGESLEQAGLPVAQFNDGVVDYVFPQARLTLSGALCSDGMTDLPYPLTAQLQWGDQQLQGCAGAPADLWLGDWKVTHWQGEALPLSADFAPQFSWENGMLSGNLGCNRFSTEVSFSGEGIAIAPVMSTRMACAEPQMAFEQSVFEALPQISGFSIAEDGALEWREGDVTVLRAVAQ